MTTIERGLISELLLARIHGRSAAYLDADPSGRAALVRACRREATVPELAEVILERTVRAQTASRTAALRELLQNALDASPRSGRIDVRLSTDGAGLEVRDRGRGMSRDELVDDLLVPFRSSKMDAPEAIGEHGVGFFTALDIATRVEVVTATRTEAWRLRIEPVRVPVPTGERSTSVLAARAAAASRVDFTWELSPMPVRETPSGTQVTLRLARPVTRSAVASDAAAAAWFVDSAVARIFVDGDLVNTGRASMRRVARAPLDPACGELALYLGKAEGSAAPWAITQAGLLVTVRQDAFSGPDLALHRDLVRAILGAGYALVVDLPARVPLNKSRSAVAACAALTVDRAIVQAFERFVLEDALYNRELLRAVDHRLSTVLDRLVHSALSGDPPPRGLLAPPAPATEQLPTVAAPEEVLRFATTLVDAPAFTLVSYEAGVETRHAASLRGILLAHRSGILCRGGDTRRAGFMYLAPCDPLAEALWRRLRPSAGAAEAAFAPRGERIEIRSPPQLGRVGRVALLAAGAGAPGVPALAAAMAILERIDQAISFAADVDQSPITVHQALYGPDEMAHTDGTGISVNLASPRVRVLLEAVLATDDGSAFTALLDLLLHEKTHVALASYIPRATAEHGNTFYRRKDELRRRLLEALACGAVSDPIRCLALERRGIASERLPSPETLAALFAPLATAA